LMLNVASFMPPSWHKSTGADAIGVEEIERRRWRALCPLGPLG
jgi:hypothetical protein